MPRHTPTRTPAHDPARGYPIVHRAGHAPATLEHLADRVADLRAASKADNTRRAYVSDWRRWATWCERQAIEALPATPATVAAYLADQAGTVAVSSLARHLATIGKAHQVAGHPNPCRDTLVRDTLAGLRRVHGQPPREAAGLLAGPLAVTLDHLGTDLAGRRDRAVLLVGWCLGLRRGDLAALRWGDLEPDSEGTGGLVVTLRGGKTDTTGQGERVGLAPEIDPGACPVRALEAWRDALGHESAAAIDPTAPVFTAITRWGHVSGQPLTGHAVAAIVKRRTAAAGLPVEYRGHSLRKGLVQAARLAGVSDSRVMATTRHKSMAMLRRYQGQVGLVTQAASAGLVTQARRDQAAGGN